MTINNKYYFIGTDLFVILRMYVYLNLILITANVLLFAESSLWHGFAITTILLISKLIWDSGYVTVDHYTKKIIAKTLFQEISIQEIQPYEYWWNYDFQEGDLEDENRSKSRSNKVIVSLVLKNDAQRIRFKESIKLDTRHPNDAIHLEESFNENTHTVLIQRVDKLMIFLEHQLTSDRFFIDVKYEK